MDMKFDACINYQYCMCIYDQNTTLSDSEKFEQIFTNIKKAYPESIRYDSDEAYRDDIFKDLHTVEGFLHGGGLPFKNNRIHIKGVDLKFEKVQMQESGIILTVFPEFNAAELQICFRTENADTDELIYLRQIFGGVAEFSDKDGRSNCLNGWFEEFAKVMDCNAVKLHQTYLIEIKKCEPYFSAEELLDKECRRLYGMICGDEGWEFVPEALAKERLADRWGSREFVRFTVFGDNALLINLSSSQEAESYMERQRVFGSKAYGGVNDYFLVDSSVAGICHGIMLSQEMVTVIRAVAMRILNRKEDFSRSGSLTLSNEIERTKRYRSELITTLNKVENLGISEMGELEQLLLRSYRISPLIDSIKYLLELLESELDLLYQQSTNRLVNILTTVGLIFTALGLLSSWGIL